MATQDFDELWNRYMWQYVTPAEYASAGWDKRVILADLIDLWRGGEDRLSDSERLDIANQIAAEFTRRGYPMTPAVKAVDRMRAVAKNVDRMRTALQEIADMAIGQTPPGSTAMAKTPRRRCQPTGEAPAGVTGGLAGQRVEATCSATT
jgi:hypothetical protein